MNKIEEVWDSGEFGVILNTESYATDGISFIKLTTDKDSSFIYIKDNIHPKISDLITITNFLKAEEIKFVVYNTKGRVEVFEFKEEGNILL